jgi:hypothetical protein
MPPSARGSADLGVLKVPSVTNALDTGGPLRDAQILARHANPRTTEHCDRARGNLDRHGVHFLPRTSPACELLCRHS